MFGLPEIPKIAQNRIKFRNIVVLNKVFMDTILKKNLIKNIFWLPEIPKIAQTVLNVEI